MQRGELAVLRRHAARHEVLAHKVRMLADGGGKIGEDHACGGKFFVEDILDAARIAEAKETGEALSALGWRHERSLPLALLRKRLDLVQPQPTQVGAPPLLVGARGHRDSLIRPPGLEAALTHPVWLGATRDQFLNRLIGETSPRDRSSHESILPIPICP